jgi:hypothetical protein
MGPAVDQRCARSGPQWKDPFHAITCGEKYLLEGRLGPRPRLSRYSVPTQVAFAPSEVQTRRGFALTNGRISGLCPLADV